MNHPLIIKVRYGFVALTTAWFLSGIFPCAKRRKQMMVKLRFALLLLSSWRHPS